MTAMTDNAGAEAVSGTLAASHDVARFLHDMEYFAEHTRPGTWQLRALKEDLVNEIDAVRGDCRRDRLKWALMRCDSYLSAVHPQDEELAELQKHLRGHSFKMRMDMGRRLRVSPTALRGRIAA